jgi:DNA-directed RNA polymerase specialized sigma24 family protein
MTTCTTLAIIAIVLTFPLVLLLWATSSRKQRARRLRSYGWTQQAIATRLRVSRSTIRRDLARA